MLTITHLTEEGVEEVISSSNGLVTWLLAIGLDAMFQATDLPAGIANLDTNIANVDGDALTHGGYGLAGTSYRSTPRSHLLSPTS